MKILYLAICSHTRFRWLARSLGQTNKILWPCLPELSTLSSCHPCTGGPKCQLQATGADTPVTKGGCIASCLKANALRAAAVEGGVQLFVIVLALGIQHATGNAGTERKIGLQEIRCVNKFIAFINVQAP